MRRGITLGLLLFLTVWTQMQGLQFTTATRSGFITALYVPLTPLLGWLFFRKTVYLRQILIALIAVFGLYFLTNQKMTTFPTWWRDVNPGDLWTLACAALAALHIIVTERFTRKEADSIALGLWQFIGCVLFTGVSVALRHNHGLGQQVPANWNIFDWPPFALMAIFILAVFCTAFAFVMQIVAQKQIGALKAALIFALEAPFSSGFAFTFLGEVMTSREFIGAAIVFLTSVTPEAWLKRGKDHHGPF